jgi:PD-(D/E)XK endonuclease
MRRARAPRKGNYYKPIGELAELVFILKASSLGLAVCKPYGDSLPFDFVIVAGCRLFRIQVKSTFTSKRRGHNIHVGCRGKGRWHLPYTPQDIDFIAAYVVAYDVWYIIPVEAIRGNLAIRVYPRGASKKDGGCYEQFRDAWHLITGTPDRPLGAPEASAHTSRASN